MSNLNELKLGSTRLLGVVLILLAACLGSFAQSISGDLVGTVYDASGAAIPNATVVVKNDGTGVANTTKSSAAGDYRVPNLPPGTYTITVTAQGFTKAEVRGVVVNLNKVATTNVKLDVGTNVATVEVTAAAAALDTTTANVQNTYSSQSMAELPVASSGSGVLNLSLLSAGVSSGGTVGFASRVKVEHGAQVRVVVVLLLGCLRDGALPRQSRRWDVGALVARMQVVDDFGRASFLFCHGGVLYS